MRTIIDILLAKEDRVNGSQIPFPLMRVGDKVTVLDSNGETYTDVVRDAFWQTTLLQPYAPNETFPALVLTERSWCPLAQVVGYNLP